MNAQTVYKAVLDYEVTGRPLRPNEIVACESELRRLVKLVAMYQAAIAVSKEFHT